MDNDEKLNAERTAFWAELAAEAPDLGIAASPGWEKEIPLRQDGRLKLKMSLSQDKTSVYLVARSLEAAAWIEANRVVLAQELRRPPEDARHEAKAGRWFRTDNKKASFTVRGQWPEMIRWLRAQHATFSRAVSFIEAP